MSLHIELAASRKADRCKLCAFLNQNPEQDEWQEELRQPVFVISHQAVVDALERRGISISEASVRRHRRNHERVR